MVIEKITFDKILPTWRGYLWENKKGGIKPMSSITIDDTIDMEIYNNIPSFFALKNKDETVGVISGFSTSESDYRCRGIYIFPEYRGQNLSKMLFRVCLVQAIKEGRHKLWSLPRRDVYPAYKSFGFKRISPWTDKFEFGPNCFVEHIIRWTKK